MITLALLVLASVSPPRSVEAALAPMKAAAPHIEGCVKRADVPASFRLHWDIAADGVPENVVVVGVVNDAARACLQRAVAALRWPRATGKSHVEVPFQRKDQQNAKHERKRSMHADATTADEPVLASHFVHPEEGALPPPDRSGILHVVTRTLPVVRAACGTSEATVRVQWVIEESGAASEITIEAPYAGTPLGTCVAAEVAKMRWQATAGALPASRFRCACVSVPP